MTTVQNAGTQNTGTQNAEVLLTEESIQQWLVSQVSQQTGLSSNEVNVQARLDSFGMDSAQAMGLMNQAENLVGFEVSPALLWHYPTIKLLSERLAEDCAEDDSEVFEL